MTRRRILLLGVAGLLCASALLAIAVLLVGRFGDTERRVVATTLLLAGYGALSLPGVLLLDQGRRRPLGGAAAALAGAAAAAALVSVWGVSGDELGKSVGTLTILAVAAAQASALAARRAEHDPPAVRRLFAASCVTAALLAAAAIALLWTQPSAGVYPRLLGALAVLDVLLVALQPLLAALGDGTPHGLRHRHG